MSMVEETLVGQRLSRANLSGSATPTRGPLERQKASPRLSCPSIAYISNAFVFLAVPVALIVIRLHTIFCGLHGALGGVVHFVRESV